MARFIAREWQITVEKRVLTSEELERLAAVAANGPLAALIEFALATGARRGELLGLKWDDIDFTRGTVRTAGT